MQKHLNANNLYFVLLSLVFILPVVLFGIKDIEIYQHGFFTAKSYLNNPKLFFNNYIDYYGPGVSLPLGAFPLINPASFFINDSQIFYFLYIFINLLIQIFFAKNLCRILEIRFNIITIICLIFSISNFNFIYSDDWPMTFWSYTCIFPCTYYLIKFFQNNKDNSFLKFLIFLQFSISFGHFGHSLKLPIFFLILFFLNFNIKFFTLKRFFYVIAFFISLSSTIIYLYSEYINFEKNLDIPSVLDSNYNLKDYFFSILNPIYNFFNPGQWPINRMPGYGILLFFVSFIFLKNKLNQKKIYKLDVVFFIIFLASISQFFSLINLPISGIWVFRDFMNFIGIIFVADFISKIKLISLKNLVSIIISCCSLMFYIVNLNSYIDFDKTNFIGKRVNDYEILNKFEQFKQLNKDYGKFYLSENIYSKIRNGYKSYGIYAITDLIEYNIHPFNGWFKYLSMKEFYPDPRKMHGYIKSNIENINNEIFLKNFLINFLMISESELEEIKINYKILKTINLTDDRILILELLNNDFPIIKNKSYSSNKCSTSRQIFCLLNEENFEFNKLFKIKRVDTNEFLIINKNPFDVEILFPFSKIENWKFNKKIEINDFFKGYKKIKVSSNQIIEATINNYNRIFYKIISIISFLILLITCLISKKFSYKKT